MFGTTVNAMLSHHLRARGATHGLALAAILVAVWLAWAAGPAWAPAEELHGGGDPALALLSTDFAAQPFPYASAVDLDRDTGPTGQHGFLSKATDGTLRFEDGTRGRFFGVNIAKTALFVDDETMDRMVEVIRAAGLNIVRLHHFDGPEGILGPERDELDLFTASRLDRLDRWIGRLGQAGIYVYLDLLDYRAFTALDGIESGEALGRGAKPYVIVDERLRVLVKDYARKLLAEHVNRYTGKPYAEDPTVAFVEVYDENGLFIRREDIPSLRAPYRQELGRAWNNWLQVRYRSTEALRAAWTDPTTRQCPLVEGESLEVGNLDLPRLVMRPASEPMLNTGVAGAARMNDAVLFLQSLQADFLRDIAKHLRGIGVRVPIGAVGSLDQPPDHAVMARMLDYIGTNFYWDHPSWPPGRAWQPPYWFADRSPLGDTGPHSLAPAVAAARVSGTPLVLREWSYCWPNQFRAAGVVELAAFCAHQGIDCVLAFTYGVGDAPSLGLFDLQSDPTRWGLLAHAAALYLHGGLQEATTRVELAYSPTDLSSFYEYDTPLLNLAYVTRLERRFGQAAMQVGGGTTLTVASGRSADLALSGSGRLLWNELRRADLKGTLSPNGVTERSGYAIPRTVPDQPKQLAFDGFIRDAGDTVQVQGQRLYVTGDLERRGYRPIAPTSDGLAALGFADAASRTWALGQVSPDTATRAAFDALGQLGPSHINHAAFVSGQTVTDTRQIARDGVNETIAVEGTHAAAVAATRRLRGALTAGPLAVESPATAYAAFAVSIDGEPLASSAAVSIRYATTCENTGQTLRPEAGGPKPFLLAYPGSAPPTAPMRESDRPLVISWQGRVLVRIYAEGGSFEFVVTPDSVAVIGVGGGATVETDSSERRRLPEGFGRLVLPRP